MGSSTGFSPPGKDSECQERLRQTNPSNALSTTACLCLQNIIRDTSATDSCSSQTDLSVERVIRDSGVNAFGVLKVCGEHADCLHSVDISINNNAGGRAAGLVSHQDSKGEAMVRAPRKQLAWLMGGRKGGGGGGSRTCRPRHRGAGGRGTAAIRTCGGRRDNGMMGDSGAKRACNCRIGVEGMKVME